MIPVGDDVLRRNVPVGTWALMVVNFLVFIVELAQGSHLQAFLYDWGLIPAVVTEAQAPPPHAAPTWLTLYTSMFLHGGWGHILGNMLFLWIFGDNVEDAMGTPRFLLFYLLCGTVAAFAQIIATPTLAVPNIGASGAVSGVLGAYLVLYPRAAVLVVVPLFLFFPFFRVPAFVMLGLWFLTEFTAGLASVAHTFATQNVAFWAHVAGFVSGAATVFLFKQKPTRR